MPEKFSEKRTLILFLAIALLVRLLFALPAMREPNRCFIPGDSEQYHRLASNLIGKRRFTLDQNPPYRPQCFRTPVYPAFLALVYSIFGVNPKVVPPAHAILGAITALLVFLVGRCFFDSQVGLAGALFYALDPVSIVHISFIMTETLFTLLFILLLYLIASGLKCPTHWRWLLAGFVLALTTLWRPVTLLFPVALAISLFLGEHQLPAGKRIKMPTVLILAYLLCLMPWVLRNGRICGIWWVDTMSYFLSTDLAVHILQDKHGFSIKKADQYILNEAAQHYRYEPQYYHRWHNLFKLAAEDATKAYQLGAVGRQVVLAHPLLAFKLCLKGMIAVLVPYVTYSALLQAVHTADLPKRMGGSVTGRAFDLLTRGRVLGALGLVWRERVAVMPPVITGIWLFSFAYGLMLYLLSLLGLRLCSRQCLPFFTLAVLTVVYFFIVSSPVGLHSLSRLRMPIQPLLCLLAGLYLAKRHSR